MNYLAQGLLSGYDSGFTAAKQAQRDKKDKETRLKEQAAQFEAQRTLQNERMVSEAARDFENRKFQGAESQLSRELRLKESADDRGFRSGESQKDREARLLEQANGFTQQKLLDEARLAASGDQFNRKLAQDGDQFNTTLGLSKDKFAWEKDPSNPENVSRGAYAAALRAKSGVDDYGPDPIGAQGGGPRPGTIVEQNGKKYRFDGKNYVPVQ